MVIHSCIDTSRGVAGPMPAMDPRSIASSMVLSPDTVDGISTSVMETITMVITRWPVDGCHHSGLRMGP